MLKHEACNSRTEPEKATQLLWLYEVRIVTAILLCLAGVYTAVAYHLNSFHAFWSPDSGARYAMIRSWVEHGRLVYLYSIDNSLDPTGQINTLSYFLFHGSRDYCAMYQPLFPLLSGLVYNIFGFHGLTLIPLLSGLGTVLTTYLAARRLKLRSRIILLPVMGLATPLVLYSVVFWDHTTIMLLVAVASYWLVRTVQEGSSRCAAIVGSVLGAGMWIHELFLAIFLAVCLTVPWNALCKKVLSGLLLGFSSITLLWIVGNYCIYGTFSGPHLGANVLQNNTDHPFDLLHILDQKHFFNRAMLQIIGAPALDPDSGNPDFYNCFFGFAYLLIVYTLTSWSAEVSRRSTVIIGLAATVMAVFLVIKPHGVVMGLFQATPIFVPALAVSWSPHTDKSSLLDVTRGISNQPLSNTEFYAWTSRICWMFVLFILINPMSPGTDWGSRYLLSLLPLLVLLSTYTLERQLTTDCRQRVALVSFVTMVGASFFCQCCGLIWVQRNIAYGRELNTHIREIHSPVLVTNFVSMGAFLTPTSLPQPQFMVRTDNDRQHLLSVLRRMNVKEFMFVGVGTLDFEDTSLFKRVPFVADESRPLWKVDGVRQQGPELQETRFVLKPWEEREPNGQ